MDCIFTIAHINIRSLTAHFAGFKDHTYNKFDIIAVSETWLNDNILSQSVNLNNYKLFRRDRSEGRGGGTAMYVKSNFKCSAINNLQLNTTEQLWVSLNYNNKKFALGVIYRPPNCSVLEFCNEFESVLNQLITKYDQVLCTGDFNIDFLEPTSNSYKLLHDSINSYSLKQIIHQPTRISSTSATLIDLIICSETLKCFNVNVEDVSDISDHSLISCSVGNNRDLVKPFLYTFRNFKHFSNDNFTNDLLSIPLWHIFYLNNIDEKVNTLNFLLNNIFDVHAPLTTVRITKKRSPWLTYNIKQMQKSRDKALQKFKQTKNTRDWEVYKTLRNHTKLAITREKKAYLEYQLNTRKKSNFWKDLQELNIYNKHHKNNLVPDSLCNVNEINNFFITSSKSDFDVDAITVNFYEQNIKPGVGEFTFKITSENEVYAALLSIKSKATGVDGLGLNMLLYCCPYILQFVTHIFNVCIENNTYPSTWKMAHIIPLPKVSEPDEYKDLRPISILPVLNKAFEIILNNQIRDYLYNFSILPKQQSGFRVNFSCTTALLKVTDDIITATDDNNLTVLVLLDYSKAFDRINHQLLLAILHYIGFSTSSVAFMKSYLENRSQAVICKGQKSTFLKVNFGVPQGSILAPLLYIIYTFDFHRHLQHCNSHFYADDTQLYLSFNENEIDTACDHINKDLTQLIKMSNNFCLSVNPLKSKVMLFGRNSARNRCMDKIKIVVNNTAIQQSDNVKNLGLIMDTSLKFSQHVTHICRKSYSNLKLLYGNKTLLNWKSKILLCEALILSHLNYADVIYGPCLTTLDNQRLQRIQNSCIRFIFNLRKYDHISHKLKEIGWLDIQKRRILHSCVLFNKILILKTPPYLFEKISYRTDIHNINIRRRSLLTIPLHSTSVFQKSFSYNIAKYYNKLPNVIKKAQPKLFKSQLKKLLLSDTNLFC